MFCCKFEPKCGKRKDFAFIVILNYQFFKMLKKNLVVTMLLLTTVAAIFVSFSPAQKEEDIYLTYTVDPKKQNVELFWKDDKGNILKSLGNVKTYVESKNKTLLFAMNAGMYTTDNAALGLFIQDGKTIRSINKRSAGGNFYMKPNGVFYIDNNNKATICKTEDFVNKGTVKYATQSGPMLVIDGNIHPSFTRGSLNVNIRNGVGILPDNQLVFVMSKGFVNFYDFAAYFKKLGCKNALFLDGAVCRTYLPGKNWVQTGGDFGVIVGVTKRK